MIQKKKKKKWLATNAALQKAQKENNKLRRLTMHTPEDTPEDLRIKQSH